MAEVQQIQIRGATQRKLDQAFNIMRHNHENQFHANQQEFLSRDEVPDYQVPHHHCLFREYNGDHDE